MADKHYNLNEAIGKLALTTEQISSLVRDGRIREFRIDGQQKFLASEIDDLAVEINPSMGTDVGSESEIELLPVDSSDGGSDVISLEESGQPLGQSDQPTSSEKPSEQDP